MKYCPNSANCPYGSIYEENICAYYDDKTDYDCPLYWMDNENMIDKISEINKTLNMVSKESLIDFFKKI